MLVEWRSMRFLERMLGVACGLLILGSEGAAADESVETNVALNRAVYQSSAADYDHTGHLTTDGSQDTYWQSAPGAEQWVYVDLGQDCRIDHVKLWWGDNFARSFKIQLSEDATQADGWKDVSETTSGTQVSGDISFPAQSARYVRLLAEGDGAAGYVLREFEVYGFRPASTSITSPPALNSDGTLPLDGDAWKVQNADFVKGTAGTISSSDFDTTNWIPAWVPGTTLGSYLKAGAIPDPRYGDQQYQISEDFFNNHDFWYRREFTVPESYRGKRISLNFDGINWKADIFLNGTTVGHIDGAFIRGAFDLTDHLRATGPNVLAVLVHKVAHPGPTNFKTLKGLSRNGGILGLDSPTFVSSIGWNWLPSIRGRDTGIWNHVYLRPTADVTLNDPFVVSDLSDDHQRADLTIKLNLVNQSQRAQAVDVAGSIGTIHFDKTVNLQGGETQAVVLDKNSCPQLSIAQPRLWWPNGYGEPALYQLHLEAKTGASVSDQRDVTFGIRKLTYDTSNNSLKISVNGHRILCDGGNWGMDEGMLLYNGQDLDTAVRLHKDMNLVMIRNWVGMVGRDEFYSACDKYGILVWNDFWLANPSDGPNPTDAGMFISNMRDKVLQIRNHPSLALYCGRNEGHPPPALDAAMQQATQELDGTRYYIPSSADGLVTGHGPYEPMAPKWYFDHRGTTFHSELGLVCVPTIESMREMLPEKELWPINDLWALHDFAQSRCRTYTKRLEDSYGPATDLADFCEKAQMLNMETAKAMLETWRSHRGSGGLIWMSQAAWPSLICQLYDYYLAPTAAYFGVKKAGEPLHILWNASTDDVQVADDTLDDFQNLTAETSVFDMDGVLKFHQVSQVDVKSGSTVTCGKVDFSQGTTPVQFIKLRLMRGGQEVSDNFYWRGVPLKPGANPENDYTSLATMKRVRLASSVTLTTGDATSKLEVTITNPSSDIALMTSLGVVKDNVAANRVLPSFYQDNYFSLLPHETKRVSIEFSNEALGHAKPWVVVQGWNVETTSSTIP